MIDKALLGNSARSIGIALDDTALERFDRYAELLVQWNERMNLTAITNPYEIVEKHFIDSLMLARYFDLSLCETVIDVGTGAGFPSLPLLIYRNNLSLTLLDSLQKRLGFLDAVLHETELFARTVHGRAEDMGQKAEYRESFDLATARAVAPMNVLAEYCMPFVRVGGYFVALKGSSDDSTDAEQAIELLGGRIESKVSYKLNGGDGRTIIVVKKISQTPTQYPRRTKKITTKPL